MLDLVGLRDKTPQKPPLAGHSYAGALTGKPISWNDAVFFEFENTRSIRTLSWKYISRFPKGPNELYDLKHDPEERHNLVDQPAHADQQQLLRTQLDKFFATYADPQYDLSRGGRSKAARRVR